SLDAAAGADGATAGTGGSKDAAAGASGALDGGRDVVDAATEPFDASGILPTCATPGPGVSNCGAAGTDGADAGESCCKSLPVSGGEKFSPMYTYTPDGNGPLNLGPQETVSSFRLDKYLVTVGRFRQFVDAWHGGAGWKPLAGSGKHIHLNGGRGLVDGAASSAGNTVYESGWSAADTQLIAPTSANLACNGAFSTWTDTPGANESLPINCVNQAEAAAFCIWDGGFLPSEAEWIYAAAGGNWQLEYPWGGADPDAYNDEAIYGGHADDPTDNTPQCHYPGYYLQACTDVSNIAPVGTAYAGGGRWGQLDLAGEANEWVLDVLPGAARACTDCATLSRSTLRIMHGGTFESDASALHPWVQTVGSGDRTRAGFRCARPPCDGGACVCAAGSGLSACGGLCVDEQTDPDNCGACGNQCPAGTSCQSGVCACPYGATQCGDTCAYLYRDSNNCGACGVKCDATAACFFSQCAECTGPGEAVCYGQCWSVDHDPTNCGACGVTCPDSVGCGGGICGKASCANVPASCGPSGSDGCCASNGMPGGTFNRSNDPSYPATVSPFILDNYEVTVGRFREFIHAADSVYRPNEGGGKHRHLNGGNGLNGGTEPGWGATWGDAFPSDSVSWDAALQSCPGSTWMNYTGPGPNDALPINCITWYEAYAFCIWDGGFLPTEAEWNYAAAGGNQQRVYPWSSPPSSTTIDCTYANFLGCGTGPDNGMELVTGKGPFGHFGLAGNVAEWVLDSPGAYPVPCKDCANLNGPGGVARGGAFDSLVSALTTSARAMVDPSTRSSIGARCARPPQ
ncbi:MAG TPA: SUMF1/EgtB/PvdO family nonheme iron enzyme, partial [Polyangia bacterium]|nr:SUMF1/EgtB/PvdO family nonheme iron enzyme [Polyangia bacterium]